MELGVRSQEPGEKSQKEEGRSQKKCFYKYEMLPILTASQLMKNIKLRKLWDSLHCDRAAGIDITHRVMKKVTNQD
ncbi:hypothetical protein [Microcoleus sp. D2_18a_B4]|uniref:hypothetical protein n=1 Tax=Microcoleus sp. D2_18a_B4 TaxID=3055329 RepID=UPI002FD2474B